MIDYWNTSSQTLIRAFLSHMRLTYLSLGIASIIAMVIIYLFIHQDRWLDRIVYFFSALYSIPSYALFVLLIPFTGLGTTSATIVLVLYSEYVLLRTFITGIKEIDPMIIEAPLVLSLFSVGFVWHLLQLLELLQLPRPLMQAV